VALALLAAACTSSHHTSASPPSVSTTNVLRAPGVRTACTTRGGVTPVEVILRMIGGPSPGLNKPVAGTVVAIGPSGDRCSITVGDESASRFDLLPGVYTITGRSPSFGDGKYECSAQQQVTVSERPPNSHGGPILVTVVCPVE
jgi:hypothetical protein